MWELDHKESWVPKNWCFWTVVLEKTLESPLESNLKEINPEYSLEGLMLKMKLQYFGHLMRRDDSLEKILMMGNIKGRRRRDWQRLKWLDNITNSMDLNLRKLQEIIKGREAWSAAVPWGWRVRHDLAATEQTAMIHNRSLYRNLLLPSQVCTYSKYQNHCFNRAR